MIAFAKSKIEKLLYSGPQSANELNKLVGATQFIIQDKSTMYSPPFEEYSDAISDLESALNSGDAGNGEKIFADLKDAALKALNTLQDFMASKNLSDTSDMDLAIYGGKRILQNNEIKLTLLMVEQNHIDFFRKRQSHLPSQPHERFSYHYMIHTEGNESRFFFHDHSDLPEYIKTEAMEALKKTAQSFQ